MVMTSVSGDGWATSMLPPPVCVNPWRLGVTCPCRDPRMKDAGGDAGVAGLTVIVTGVPGGTGVTAGGGAAPIARGQASPSRPAVQSLIHGRVRFRFMSVGPPDRYHRTMTSAVA